MTPGGRLSAAMEVLSEVLERHRPVSEALADWGKAHRFAGSGDRAAIGNLVYDALRHKLSIAARMAAESPRALAVGAAGEAWSLTADAIAAHCSGEGHAPAHLSSEERHNLERALPDDTPDHVRADVPAWLWPQVAASLGADAVGEARALAHRAPIDLRVNTLKASREKVLKALAAFSPGVTPISPLGVRLKPPQGAGRSPNVQAEPAFQKGLIEVQDEGSQVASVIAAAAAGKQAQILDMCAGGGGKTLALSALTENRGQIFAHDTDRFRLAPIHERLRRAGARNVQVLAPGAASLTQLEGRLDCVVIDAPCTGTGVWRRRPEAKWRLTPEQLTKRIEEQRAILLSALPLLKAGGRLVYITCSLLAAENEEQVAWLGGRLEGIARRPLKSLADLTPSVAAVAPPEATQVTLTPLRHGTDGFFVAVLKLP